MLKLIIVNYLEVQFYISEVRYGLLVSSFSIEKKYLNKCILMHQFIKNII